MDVNSIETCEWVKSYNSFDDEYYLTLCGTTYMFTEGDIKFNLFKHCPYCGKQIEEYRNEIKECNHRYYD